MGCALGAGSSRACLQERAAAGGSSSAEERGRAELLKEERYLRETGCLKPISAGDQRNGGDRSLQAGLLPQRCVRGRSGAAPRPLCSRCAPCPAAPSAGMELRLRSALASRSLKRMSKSSWPGAVLLPLLVAQRAARLCWSPRFGHIPTPGAPLPADRGRSPVPSTEKHTALISLQVPSARCHHSPCPGCGVIPLLPANSWEGFVPNTFQVLLLQTWGQQMQQCCVLGSPPHSLLAVRASQARPVPSPAPITPQRDKDGTSILNAATAVYQRDLESFERKSVMNSPTVTGTERGVTTYPSPYIQIY